MRPFALLLALVLVAPACGRKKAPPPIEQPAVQKPAVEPRPLKAPPGVPDELRRLVEREWPGILKEGDAFLAKFKEFQNAQGSGDRAAMSALVEEARPLCQSAMDKWADIAYWVENKVADGAIDEATADKCRDFLRDYEKRVKEWESKNKVLKEFSTAK
jgi:hypothetical protein